ncbi:MAG TPA: DUF2934 domain-containing protein [Opitutaceae bacterium]|nr:DUF2934 domain-containing protein [Opitutaceae bacterium]
MLRGVNMWNTLTTMKTPTHNQISERAFKLWQDRGCPEGSDSEFWLEAERQLSEGSAQDAGSERKPFAERAKEETAAESVVEYQISPAIPQHEAIKAAIQKEEARAPQVPTHTAPKSKPAETGKPLWSKPHSS